MTQLRQQRTSLWEGSAPEGHVRWNPCHWLQWKKFILGEKPLYPYLTSDTSEPHLEFFWVLLSSSVTIVGQKRSQVFSEDIVLLSFEDTQLILFDGVWSGHHLHKWAGTAGPPPPATPLAQTLLWPFCGSHGLAEGYSEYVAWPRG